VLCDKDILCYFIFSCNISVFVLSLEVRNPYLEDFVGLYCEIVSSRLHFLHEQTSLRVLKMKSDLTLN